MKIEREFRPEPLKSVTMDCYEVAMERYGSKSEQVRTSAWLLGKDVY
jgi:hypothetical protein